MNDGFGCLLKAFFFLMSNMSNSIFDSRHEIIKFSDG